MERATFREMPNLLNRIHMKSSRLERKIKEDPLTWGTPEMRRIAKQRLKSGLSVDLNDHSVDTESPTASASNAPSSSASQKSTSTAVASPGSAVSNETVAYPEIRAKYDAKIANTKASKAFSQSDKKTRIKQLENRYLSEVKEKTYQKFVVWSFVGFLVVVATLFYVKSSLI